MRAYFQENDSQLVNEYSSLWSFIFMNPSNRWFVRIGIGLVFFQFVIFKFFYPFAGFINGDSYLYLETAYHNLTINTYPIGYSKFLRLVSVFTRSDTFLVGLQYLLLMASVLSFVFTIFYFYSPSKFVRLLLLGFMVLNPVFLYLANYISSDSFFLSLSLAWFTLLIWIMNKPSGKMIFVNSLILFVAFTVRYNALFYPVIGAVALLMVRRHVLMNLAGFAVSMLFIGLFVLNTTHKYKEMTGYSQFSPFTGWQLANNALYAYRYVDSAHLKVVPPRFREIDGIVRTYFDSTRDVEKHPAERLIASTVYMWDPTSPLTIYMERQFKGDTTTSYLKKWASVAPIMKEYGSFIIHSYPSNFVKYYLVPNAVKYYAPPVEFLNQYSTGVDSVNQIAQVWFSYKTNKISCRLKDFNVKMLDFYPVLTGTMNVVLVLSMLSFVILKGYKHHGRLAKGLILVVVLWTVNFAFSVFASPVALRFQLFPILVSVSFAFLLMEYLVKVASGAENGQEKADGIVPSSSESLLSRDYNY